MRMESSSVRSKNQSNSTQWIALKINQKVNLCLSAWITSHDYQQCVQAQKCDASVSWGHCRGKLSNQDAMNCLNLKQAVQVSQWLKARLLEPADLSWIQHHCPECLNTTAQSSGDYWSWIWGNHTSDRIPAYASLDLSSFEKASLYQRDDLLKQEQESVLLWNHKKLKSNKKALIFSPHKGKKQLKSFPVGFQASHMAVRAIKLPTHNQCKSH